MNAEILTPNFSLRNIVLPEIADNVAPVKVNTTSQNTVSVSMDGMIDAVDITNLAREMEIAHQGVKDSDIIDTKFIDVLREKLDNLPTVSEIMADVIAEKIIKGYTESILAL
ncbi:MAG: hypothetical protein AB1765_12475 [Candidatus Hydrogenedentota bacterium]